MEEWRRVLIAAVPLLSVCMLLARVRGDDDAEARGRMAEDDMTNFVAPGAKAWHAETAARASSALKRRLAGISRDAFPRLAFALLSNLSSFLLFCFHRHSQGRCPAGATVFRRLVERLHI
jgi:hypothetical protein